MRWEPWDPRVSGPGFSQARVLLLLEEQGPVPTEDVYWRSRTAAKSWGGTQHWLTLGGWWVHGDDGLTRITDAGRDALRVFEAKEPASPATIRSEFRAIDDPYWVKRMRGSTS